MTQQEIPRPTDAELAILQVLWQRGPSTVRQVQEELNTARPTGYTTVLKLMQIMTEKGLVARDESQLAHVYRAAYSEEQTQRRYMDHVLDRVFGGSRAKMVLQALGAGAADPEELAEIRQLLDKLEKEGT